MATIKERAIAYRKEAEQSIYKSLEDMSTMEIEHAYFQGATEQLAIDIEKACDLFADCMNDAVKNGVLSSDFARNNIETFRKYLTEQNG